MTNNWVLVTGSAHRVGKAIAEKFVSQGYNLYLHYNQSEEKAVQTKHEFEKYGQEIKLIQADLSDTTGIDYVVEMLPESGLKVLVNSAAEFMKKDFLKVGSEEWDHTMEVSLKAPFLLTQAVAGLMANNEGNDKGSIVNISDLSGIMPWKGYSTHGIAKAGLIHLTKTSALELSPEIRVNAIVPGIILKPDSLDSEGRWKQMIANVPLKRSGDPQNIAEAAYFLATNSFVTGIVLPVDGGESLVGSINHL